MSELNDESPLRLADGDVTVHDWEQAAAAVLRRMHRAPEDPAQVWDALARSTVEGVIIPPLGTAERAAGRVLPVEMPLRSSGGWDVRSAVFDADPTEASAAALTELENGATSLWFTVGGAGVAPTDLAVATAGVHVSMAPVVVRAAGAVTELQAATSLAQVLRRSPDGVADGTNLGADPIGRAVASADPPDPSDIADVISDILALATDLGVRGFVVDGTVAHDRGAGDTAELGYAMAAGVQYLRALQAAGLGVEQAAGLLEFRLAITDDQFASIAKLRAARALWARICRLSGMRAGGMRLHGVTSLPMTTRYDPWVNLLRTTVAAFAGGVGGADAITVLPFDIRLGVPDAFGRRMARNISALLVEESHVAAVADPTAGAYAVEMLTADLADAAWSAFQAIERSSGVLGALADGSLAAGWAQTADLRRKRIAARRLPITGVSEFPNLTETLPTREPWIVPPPAVDWAADFEAMRDEPVAEDVFVATLGPAAEHSARAGFVTNLLAAGGIRARTAGRTDVVADLVAAYRGEQVVVLAGADTAYASWGPDAIAALRAAGAGTIILAGRPAPEVAELVDDHVAVGQDVVDFLRRLRAQLSGEVVRT